MTQINKINRDFDELEQALAEMPIVTAPKHTMSQILARIATLPQLDVNAAALSIGLVPPRIRYVPPVVAPQVNANNTLETEPSGRFNPLGYLLIGLWFSLCLTGLYLVWPAISDFVFGPSQDPGMVARLQSLQSWWNNLTLNLGNLFNLSQPYLPTIISAFAGVAIMLYFFGQQQRRLWR